MDAYDDAIGECVEPSYMLASLFHAIEHGASRGELFEALENAQMHYLAERDQPIDAELEA